MDKANSQLVDHETFLQQFVLAQAGVQSRAHGMNVANEAESAWQRIRDIMIMARHVASEDDT